MPNHIAEVTITGLWGRETPIRLPFGRRLNFIIGRNGTGKTTVINLIAAVLLADFERLDKIVFSKVVIQLKPLSGKKRPSIEVTKTPKPQLPYSDIEFKVRLSSEEEVEFDLDAFAEEQAYRGAPQRYLRDRLYREKFLYVKRQLEQVANVTWLSVYRSADERERAEERRFHSAVDQKLALINIELVKYFAKLSTSFDEKTKEFQKTSFLSLTQADKQGDIDRFFERVDIEHERVALEGIFKLLGVEERQYRRQLSDAITRFTDARKKLVGREGMSLEELFSLLNAYRAHWLVELYENLQHQSTEIFGPRQAFLAVLNDLLKPRKQAALSVTNELVITPTQDASKAHSILLEELSSGEKQLLIILGQALLQEGKTAIYIADEPELSLHVEWQEQITAAIERLNPNAQIIFATHSPDIVGRHADAVLDMEHVYE
jgi:predicted ATPase